METKESDCFKKINLSDTRKAMEDRINLLQDWIDYQITMYGGKSNVEQINKINQENKSRNQLAENKIKRA